MYSAGSGHEFAGVSTGATNEQQPEDFDVYEDAEQLTGQQYVEAGPRNLQLVKLTDIHLLQQVRREYNEQDIEALAWSMIKDWNLYEAAQTPEEVSAAIDIYHTPILNRVSPDYLPQYLEDHARFYNTPVPVLYTEPGQDISINAGGHRRYLAYEFLLKHKGFTKDDGKILCQVEYDLTHAEVLARQLRENIKTNPPPQDEVLIVERLAVVYEQDNGLKPTAKQLAAFTGLTEDKVRAALAFTSLPKKIQDYLGKDPKKPVIPYSTLVRFKPLQDAVMARYDQDNIQDDDYSTEQRDEYVEASLGTVAKHIAQMRVEGRSAARIDEVLTAKIRTAQGELKLRTDELFVMEEARNPNKRSRVASNNLAAKAVEVLQLLAQHGELEPKYIGELQAVYDLMDRQKADASIPDDQEAMF